MNAMAVRMARKKKNHSLLDSMTTAASGLREALQKEKSIRRILWFAVIVIGTAFYLQLPLLEMLLVLIVWSAVLTGEFLNTSLEKALDYSSDHEYHPLIRKGKDYAGASVFLMASVAWIVTGALFIRQLS